MTMSREQMGLIAVVTGVIITLGGVLIWAGLFRWFGHLPGDIRIDSDKVRVYFPLASMLLISLVLSLVWHLVRRFFS
jgi:hypothetical protein